jgi:uncharacterized lipoprotein YajG
MNTKKLVVLAMFVSLLVTGCASAPQMLKVSPILVLDNLQGVTIPVELVISDQRENVNLLGYRTAKNESEIGFSQSVAKSMGESIQSALIHQGVRISKDGNAGSRLEVQLNQLSYTTPDENWVSSIEVKAEVLLVLSRSEAVLKKRFNANRKQDVIAAPTKEFNQEFMNTLISELINNALNDKEIASFLK